MTLLWLHCAEADNLGVALSLARHLVEHGDMPILVTRAFAGQVDRPDTCPSAVTWLAEPVETAGQARNLVIEREPTALVWVGGKLSSSFAASAAMRLLPAIGVNLDEDAVTPRGLTWGSRSLRGAVSSFTRLFVTSGAASARLQKFGVPADRIDVTGPILPEPTPPGYDINEFTVMAEAVGSRPSWFAVSTVAEELALLCEAHRVASRRGYRLLLVLSPRDHRDGGDYARQLRQMGLRVGLRSEGDDPQEDTQAYVIDLPDETGLWYRMSPVAFMGGTFSGAGSPPPFDPASLGAAVVHGPHTDPWSDQYGRLSDAAACRKVHSGPELGTALTDLMAPDRCATMAQAGWQEVTRSAAAMNRVVQRALGLVDSAGSR